MKDLDDFACFTIDLDAADLVPLGQDLDDIDFSKALPEPTPEQIEAAELLDVLMERHRGNINVVVREYLKVMLPRRKTEVTITSR